MQEIWIPELLVTLFLLLHILRPLAKKFASTDGFAWLPLPCLLITIVLFPAYGFRPELIPLLLYAAILSVFSIPRQLNDDTVFGQYGNIRLVFVVVLLVILAAVSGTAMYFAPIKDTALSSNGVFTLRISAGAANAGAGSSTGIPVNASGEREYFFRMYTDENDSRPSQRPLMVILPPALGSAAVVDQISCELRDRGFTVLVSSRHGFDSPAIYVNEDGKQKRYGIGAAEWVRRIRTAFSVSVSAKTYLWGRSMEEERKEDLLFVLSILRQNVWFEKKGRLFDFASRDKVFFTGYDAGGSALILLEESLSGFGAGENRLSGAGGPESAGRMPEPGIRGLIAVESSLWSIYREETKESPELPPDAGWFASVNHGIRRWFLELTPKKISGLGQIPELNTPLLLLVSDRSRNDKYRDGKYQALLGSYKAACGPAALISADGTGPLDYSDVPVKYPIITALFPGPGKSQWKNLEAPGTSAGIIAWFVYSILNAQGEAITPIENISLPEAALLVTKKNFPKMMNSIDEISIF